MAETDDIRSTSTKFRTTRYPAFQGGEIDAQGNLAPVTNARNPQPLASPDAADTGIQAPSTGLANVGLSLPEPKSPDYVGAAAAGAAKIGASTFGEGVGSALESGATASEAISAGGDALTGSVNDVADFFGLGASEGAAEVASSGLTNVTTNSIGYTGAPVSQSVTPVGVTNSSFGSIDQVPTFSVGSSPGSSLGSSGAGGAVSGGAGSVNPATGGFGPGGAGGVSGTGSAAPAGAAASTATNTSGSTFGSRLTSGSNLGGAAGAGIAAAAITLISGGSPGEALKSGAATFVGTAIGNAILPGVGGIIGGFIGGAVGGRVICTELAMQGRMSPTIMLADVTHAERNIDPQVIAGYHVWALDVVRWMRRDDLLGKLAIAIAGPLAIWRAEEVSYQMGWTDTECWEGKFVRWIGEPLCHIIGGMKEPADYRQLYQEAA